MEATKHLAMNIVNQLFDLAEVPVDKRQAINDKADAFVERLLHIEKDHDCIKRVRAELMQDESVAYVRFDLDGLKNVETKVSKTGHRITVGVKSKKKDGTEVIKDQKTFIAHDYCPYCGKKYEK